MDVMTSTENLNVDRNIEENLLLEIIKNVCSEEQLSGKVKGKVNRIIADCDLTHHSSLHKLSTVDEQTSTLLGLMQQTTTELTFDEQIELNQAIIKNIQDKIPKLTKELDKMTNWKLNKDGEINKKSKCHYIKELQESLEEKLNTLQEQENEKVSLMMEWMEHRLQQVSLFSENSTELLTLKTRILELKSKILYLQILQNIFTETNQSIKSYSEVHKDLKESIRETEERIQKYQDIINKDINI